MPRPQSKTSNDAEDIGKKDFCSLRASESSAPYLKASLAEEDYARTGI